MGRWPGEGGQLHNRGAHAVVGARKLSLACWATTNSRRRAAALGRGLPLKRSMPTVGWALRRVVQHTIARILALHGVALLKVARHRASRIPGRIPTISG